MRSNTSLLGRDFLGIALQARHLNENNPMIRALRGSITFLAPAILY